MSLLAVTDTGGTVPPTFVVPPSCGRTFPGRRTALAWAGAAVLLVVGLVPNGPVLHDGGTALILQFHLFATVLMVVHPAEWLVQR